VIRTVDPAVPVKAVRARRGKWLRAEPVAALYQQGRVLHAGRFADLEDEMCDFGPNGLSNNRSPDRVDALVWAVSELMQEGAATPRIRDV
jgi:phage terminase large subunit-like protein